MANPRTLDKRRKSVRNIKKITRTMELIATARFKQAMDRASAATAFTQRITQLVKDLTAADLQFEHPLLEKRDTKKKAVLLVLTSNRGLCGGYNGNICRAAFPRLAELQKEYDEVELRISGKKGIAIFRIQKKLTPDESYLQFEDKPKYEEVEPIAVDLLDSFQAHEIDRLDVAYMKFISSARQEPTLETLLPLGALEGASDASEDAALAGSMYEFIPSAESILEEVVPTSFKVKLFKCFLDSAVCEQIARMVAMKAATENANDLIKYLSREYNRARQGRITNEIMEIIGGVEALASS
ncbi:ATP synthase F1 subunit gamma [Bremerella sp. T1]|uniref:ATP synthase F1 subunit gamma n=1 Tax=Bremerella sp. TYQ1 TaxID=3119568 RepID=UPI001CCFDC6A|nr:ATP synthase F1 subunit gamma [Bremerella volcania]UBM38094.1 ATP synthase F1 subunit gamma [Bremerella volcania]